MGFTLFLLRIIYHENSLLVAMLVIGFLAGALYSLLTLQADNAGRRKFWLEKNA